MVPCPSRTRRDRRGRRATRSAPSCRLPAETRPALVMQRPMERGRSVPGPGGAGCTGSSGRALRPLTCAFGAPRGIRTPNRQIRSKPAPVRLVLPGRIATGRVGSVVQPVTSWQAPSQRPDCQRDCQPYDRPWQNVKSNRWTPHRPVPSSRRRDAAARSTADNSSSATGSRSCRPCASRLIG
jgi:hypothetical protein